MNRVPGRVRLARALRAAGSRGVHTLDVREQLRCGNPGERRADLERRGFLITSTVEMRNGCHGARYVMVLDAGDSAAWLTDAHLDDADIGGGGSSPPAVHPAVADVSAEQMCWYRDFTDPEGDWQHVPLSEAVGPQQGRLGEAA